MPHPKVIRSVRQMQQAAEGFRTRQKRIGLVPTMGYLHEGHCSLIQQAARRADQVVVSLFVNPTQFGPKEDFKSYPTSFDRDLEVVNSSGGTIVFAPTAHEMYPLGSRTSITVGKLSEHLCGARRPGHFEGVATIVAKLFNAVIPHFAVFGQKDAQQLGIIRRMVQDLNMGVEIVSAPTVREVDGLAKSSRNTYLDPQERQQAAVLFQALQEAREMVCAGEKEVKAVLGAIKQKVRSKPRADVEYISAVDPAEFQPVEQLTGTVLLALAVRFGNARLIDNLILNPAANSNRQNFV